MRVATTLFRTDSSGCVSISGTCLYAAAWKTTVGRYFSNTSRRSALRSLTSTSFGTAGVKSRSATSSRSISNSAVSALSTRISRAGPTRAIWRQSSEPIEPPAPVTRTVWPSQIAGHLLEVDLDLLAAEHVLHLHRAQLPGEAEVAGDQLVQARQRLDRDPGLLRRARRCGGAPRPRRTASRSAPRPGWRSRRTCGRSAMRAEHAHAMIRAFRLRGSSSTKPIGV